MTTIVVLFVIHCVLVVVLVVWAVGRVAYHTDTENALAHERIAMGNVVQKLFYDSGRYLEYHEATAAIWEDWQNRPIGTRSWSTQWWPSEMGE